MEHKLLTQLLEESQQLPVIPSKTTYNYRDNRDLLLKSINSIMDSNSRINELTGFNPRQIMYDNHRHHQEFMHAVFCISDYRLLVRTVPWVYRAYKSLNFSYEYFPIELQAWISSMEQTEFSDTMKPIIEIYRWMISKHDKMVELAEKNVVEELPIHPDWLSIKNHFQVSLLTGDSRTCKEIATDFIRSNNLHDFYTQIVQPAMYEVGYLWEKGVISVAQEHLASSIVTRVMAYTINELKFDFRKNQGQNPPYSCSKGVP